MPNRPNKPAASGNVVTDSEYAQLRLGWRRYGVLAPLGLIIPPLRKLNWERFSTLAINPDFRRRPAAPRCRAPPHPGQRPRRPRATP